MRNQALLWFCCCNNAGFCEKLKQYADVYDIELTQQLGEYILERTAAPVDGPPEARGAGLADATAAVTLLAQLADEYPAPLPE